MLRSYLDNWKNKLSRVTSSRNYISEVDGLRFIAIMPVIIQHLSERLIRNTPAEFTTPIAHDQLAFLASRGTIGVFIFFAISGFILAFPFAKYHLMKGRKVKLKDYFIRRITRLEPPYIIWMSIFFVILFIKANEGFGALALHYITSIFYIHNFVFGDYSIINPVAWSLEIEIQFYILAPTLTALFFSIQHKLTRRFTLIGSIFLWISLQHHFGWWFAPYKMSILGQMQHFLIGFLALDFFLFDWRNHSKKNRYLDLAAIACLFLMAYTWTTEYWKNLVFATSLFVVFVAAFQGNLFRKFLCTPWIAIIGGMCYTIYLVHLPFIELLILFTKNITLTNYYIVNMIVQTLLIVPILLIFSAIAFYYLEKPFMKKNGFQNFKLNISNWFNKSQIKKNVMTKSSMIVVLISFSCSIIAQSNLSTNIPTTPLPTPEEEVKTIFEIKELEQLIPLAMMHSPALREQDLLIKQKGHQANLHKRKWADLLTFSAGWNRGTTNLLDQNDDGTNVNLLLIDRTNSYYSVGFQFSLSPSDILNYKDLTTIAKIEIEKAQIRKQTLEYGLREEVIKRYHNLTSTIEILEIKVDLVESNKLALEITEKYFKEGNQPASEYATMLAKTKSAEEELIRMKNAAKIAYQLLEEIVGTSIKK